MNKAEFIKAIADETGISAKQIDKMVKAAIKVTEETVSKGEDIILTGFGTFKLVDRPERMGMNPSTKEKMVIPAHRVPMFRPGAIFKEIIKKNS